MLVYIPWPMVPCHFTCNAPASRKLGDKFSKNPILTACVFVFTLRKRTDERDAKLEETT